jgi:competence protein ComEA
MLYLFVGYTTIKKWLKKTTGLDRFLIFVFVIGAVIVVISLFRGILDDREVQVEYLKGGNQVSGEADSKIFVDIEGEVISPGVYELADGSRVKDVLMMAGGLSGNADREFCEKNLNLSEVLKDSQKIYIPALSDTPAMTGYSVANSNGNRVCINTATVAELDTLWGIGPARAEAVVKNRPYQSIDDLVSKGVLTKSIVDKNRDSLTVY